MSGGGLVALLLAASVGWFDDLLRQAFYPTLLLVFIIASLGIPIPEDIPLIAAGVILRTHPEIADWPMALFVALVGIMSGDVILYTLGKRWGPDVFAHRSVAWLVTHRRMEMMTEKFHKYGVWMCFFGRFMVGVRAVMCLTAGVTRFPFWKFFLADFSGALLSAPAFMLLGYFCAGMIDRLEAYIKSAKWVVLGSLALLGLVLWAYQMRRMRRQKLEDERLEAARAQEASIPASSPQAAPSSPLAPSGRSAVPASRE